jgi:hypothetical protein
MLTGGFWIGLAAGGVAGAVSERILGRPLDRFVLRPVGSFLQQRRLSMAARTYNLSGEVISISDHRLFVHQFAVGGFWRQDMIGDLRPPEDLGQLVGRSICAAIVPDIEWLKAQVMATAARLDDDPHNWNGAHLALYTAGVLRDLPLQPWAVMA